MFIYYLTVIPLVCSQSTTTTDYDLNGKRVTYYPEPLMISRNPHALVFYHNTQLLNILIDLKTPTMSNDFSLNNTCDKETSHLLGDLLAHLRTTDYAAPTFISWFHFSN